MSATDRLFKLIEKNHVTQKVLCDATGISVATMSAWKKRGTEPPASDLYALAKFFNTSVDFFITGEIGNIQTALLADENELLENYRKLSSRGKYKLHTFLYDELDRISNETQKISNTGKNPMLPYSIAGRDGTRLTGFMSEEDKEALDALPQSFPDE